MATNYEMDTNPIGGQPNEETIDAAGGQTDAEEKRSRSRDGDVEGSQSCERDVNARGRLRMALSARNPFHSPRRRSPRPIDHEFTFTGYPMRSEYTAASAVRPEDIPLPRSESPSKAGENDAFEDVDMGEEEFKEPYVVHAPALPTAPTFSGSSKAELRAFMRSYQKYVTQVNALRTAGARPFLMPVSACIDHFAKRRVALWDFQKPYEDISEEEWVGWFSAAFEEDPRDLETLRRRLTSSISFDMRILDAESRVSKMLDDLMRALERDNQEWLLYEEGKMVVEIMAKAIKPSMLQTAVHKQLQLQKNKPLKSDVFRFVSWFRQFANVYQIFGDLEKEETPHTSGGGANARKGKKTARQSPSDTPGQQGRNNQQDSNQPARKQAECIKCKSTRHKVADCPHVKPGEADELLAAQIRRWKEDREKKPGVKKLASAPARATVDGGAIVADKVAVRDLLLDTGANVNVASAGLIRALQECGVALDIIEDTLHTPLYPYGNDSPPVQLKRRVRLDVSFYTICGQLALRSFPVWIDDDERDTSLIISRRAMEVLSYSTDVLLAEARAKQSDYDMSGCEFLPYDDTACKRLAAGEPSADEKNEDDYGVRNTGRFYAHD
ncbi:hypothetical protein AC1031_012264 [Aphanomyces cochlioides]|nr:hypothetical protein AC1031_012264 [Aphanomyces cochlioides]